VVVADEVAGEDLGRDLVELDEGLGQGLGPGDEVRAAGGVELDPVARGQDHQLVAGEGACEEIQPRDAFRPVEGERLAHRGRRGPVIDTQGQQSHGVVNLPAARAAPWTVGSLRASTPTQVKTRKEKATIVRTIRLRPRMAGRNRAWSRI